MKWKLVAGTLGILLLFMATDKFAFGQPSGQYPPSNDFERSVSDALDRLLPEKIFNSIWDDFFYYFTNFDSMEGSTGDNTFENTGSVAITLDGWEVATAADVTAASFMQKAQIPTLGGGGVGLNKNLSWGQRQRFRANFSFADTTDANSPKFTAYLVRGATPQSSFNHPYFGFKIVNTSLYGVTNGGSESTILLATLSNATAYIVEARYFPGEKIVFLVMNNTTRQMEEKGVLATNLPGVTNANTETFYGMEITRTDNHTVQLLGSFFEYIQQLRKF
jgi:hypothetical protein